MVNKLLASVKLSHFIIRIMVLKIGPGREPERGVVPVLVVGPVVELVMS